MASAGVRSLIRVGAQAIDQFRRRSGLVVLVYHRVGGRTDSAVDLPTDLFREQMRHLREHCRVLSIDDAVLELLGSPPADPRRAVVVTFDDGTEDFIDEAVPVLAEEGVPACMYLATGFVEDQVQFPGSGVPLTWGGAREALSTGLVTIGSHTHTHRLLDRATAGDTATELDRSIEMIGDRLGVDARHFAYPKALRATGAVEREVRRRFDSAAIARTRANRYRHTDAHRLTRSPLQVSDGMEWFIRKLDGGMAFENDVRDVVNRWRYRRSTD